MHGDDVLALWVVPTTKKIIEDGIKNHEQQGTQILHWPDVRISDIISVGYAIR